MQGAGAQLPYGQDSSADREMMLVHDVAADRPRRAPGSDEGHDRDELHRECGVAAEDAAALGAPHVAPADSAAGDVDTRDRVGDALVDPQAVVDAPLGAAFGTQRRARRRCVLGLCGVVLRPGVVRISRGGRRRSGLRRRLFRCREGRHDRQ